MPRFLVRLEDPDSQHFRETTINGAKLTKEDAREFCEERERRMVDYRFDGNLADADTAQRLMHRQSKPYKVVSVKEA